MRSGIIILKSVHKRSDSYDENPAISAAATRLFDLFHSIAGLGAVYKARTLTFSFVDGTYHWYGNEGAYIYNPTTRNWSKTPVHRGME